MKKYGVPTADFETFSSLEKALAHIKTREFPLVIKADGLAAGKGVFICENYGDASAVLEDLMQERRFGASGEKVVIEDYLEGPEVSVMVFSDGETFAPMAGARDYKRVFDGDLGGNTGGMGALSPTAAYTGEIAGICMTEIIKPTFAGLKNEGVRYTGVLYFGLMITPKGPKVIEYNCRFGDPETEVVLPRLKTSLPEVLFACAEGRLADVPLEWSDESAVCVMLTSGGYPGEYKRGLTISGLEAGGGGGVTVFHAGTLESGGRFTTNGGRVLCVSAMGKDLDAAAARAYAAVKPVSFDGMFYRKDIAAASPLTGKGT